MRRILHLLLMIVFMLFVFGCNEKAEEVNLQEEFNSVFKNIDTTSVTSDLVLPESVGDVEFVWESSNQDVFTNKGEVNRQDNDVTVTLKATLKYDELEENFNIVLIIKGLKEVNEDADFDEAIESIKSNINFNEVTNDLVLPAEYDNINILWESSNPNILSNDGKVTRVFEDVEVSLKATLFKDNKYKEYVIEVIVKAEAKNSYYTAEDINNYDGKIEITLRIPSGIISKSIETLVPEFESQWNGKIDVKLLIEPSGYDGVKKTTLLDINNNSAPTMVLGYADHFAEYYESGALLNLQPYINMEGKSFDIDDFVETYLDENRIVNNSNDLYGMPFNKSSEVLCYNKTVFDYMGYKVPTTWQELEKLSEQIIADIKSGKLDNIPGIKFDYDQFKPSKLLEKGQFYPFAYDSSSNAFVTICEQWNAEYVVKETTGYGYAVFDNQECKDGLAYFQNLADKKIFALAETFDSNYASDVFKSMKCLMTIGSSAGVGYNDTNRFEMGIAEIPYNVNNPDNRYVIQQGANMGILNQDDPYQKAAAWQLLKWLTSSDVSGRFCVLSSGFFPVRKSSYTTKSYLEFLTEPNLDEYIYSKSANVMLSYLDKGYKLFYNEAFVGASEINSNFVTLMNDVIVNKKDINSTIKEIISKLNNNK